MNLRVPVLYNSILSQTTGSECNANTWDFWGLVQGVETWIPYQPILANQPPKEYSKG